MIIPPNNTAATLGRCTLSDYVPLIGPETADRIWSKARRVSAAHVVHISSTFYGGGVSELLTPLTLMMNELEIETGWRMIQGTPAFFAVTKKMHNALQGGAIELLAADQQIYEQVIFENSIRLHIEDCDAVIVHDPQPLALVDHFSEREVPWFWQCHVDLSEPQLATWKYLRQFAERYDANVFTLPEFGKPLATRQRFIKPAINPFSDKNRELSGTEISDSLSRYQIPTDRPLIVQISRFDRWKDPVGVIEAFRRARAAVDCTLVLLGNNALDDPEAEAILETLSASKDERIIVLNADDPILVNALQRTAAVVLQKSTREGFGLTVTEAMWKGAVVIGGNIGGIRRQITDGENGYLVDSVDEAAARIVQILRRPELRYRLGGQARETVRRNCLMTRLAEDWIDLLTEFAVA